MGLFDFLKPKKDPLDELTENDPRLRKTVLMAWSERIAKQAENLYAVGRKDDADKTISEFLQKVFGEFKNEPQNPRHLSLLTDVAMRLDALEAGKITLESVIKENDHLSLDLTLVYTDLGRIYHDLRDPDREVWCYEKGAEAKAPPDCKFPATRRQKAIAHYFAHICLTNMSNTWEFYMKQRGARADEIARAREKHLTDKQRADSHIKKAREFVPEVNWDDYPQVRKLVISEK
jgi:hypothetical protein